MDPVRWLVEAMLQYDLRRAFRRVYWVGTWPPPLPEGPLIAYANHHHYYDGHLGWLLFQHHLNRSATLWMAEWDRFPFFGAVGAQPFPPDDSTRRAATLRRTARRFRETPSTVLIYYPGGELQSPDEAIAPFDPNVLQRLASLYPQAQWFPLAIHVTWRGHARPTAFLTGGPAHDADGQEHDRLTAHWNRLHRTDHSPLHCLSEGGRSASERWSFSFATPFFKRYL
ncbi:acyltransferase [Salinibacter sp. 10B]|uniref:acyltransferase n=1 Tax=Salinibacter sp. 10B TaxID=1923971 RepID=UPI000CF3E6D3|nr:acyltransferase [Salinibacter sp. 10B]PQJ33955.1 acyltransferase [Salinibacter sp. 10B]